MSRIALTFAGLAARKKKALITFVMAGDPDLKASADILTSLVQAGSDIIEIGMPFSDPMADGPTIQDAGLRALKSGVKLADIFELVREFRRNNDTTPIVLMGYANSVYSHGVDTFIEQCVNAGVDGLIIVDLPPEEASKLNAKLAEQSIDLIRLIAPTTKGARLKEVLNSCTGFVYYVSITGVTGSKAADVEAIKPHLQEIKSLSNLPVAIGFGIKTAADVKQFAALSDGVVVGSSIVKVAHESQAPAADVKAFVTTLAGALA